MPTITSSGVLVDDVTLEKNTSGQFQIKKTQYYKEDDGKIETLQGKNLYRCHLMLRCYSTTSYWYDLGVKINGNVATEMIQTYSMNVANGTGETHGIAYINGDSYTDINGCFDIKIQQIGTMVIGHLVGSSWGGTGDVMGHTGAFKIELAADETIESIEFYKKSSNGTMYLDKLFIEEIEV